MPGGPEDEEQRRQDAARLAALEARLGRRTPPPAASPGSAGQTLSQANIAWRMVIELVAGLVIGFVIGWGLDRLLGTRPILLVVFVLLGLAAGVKTMLRTAREIGAPPPGEGAGAAGTAGPAAAQERTAPEGVDDDEDEDR